MNHFLFISGCCISSRLLPLLEVGKIVVSFVFLMSLGPLERKLKAFE